MTTGRQEEAHRRAGEQIRTLRQSAGLSQEDVSMDADVDQSTLSKLERLGPAVMSLRKLEAVAGALGCVVQITFAKVE